MKKYDLVVIGSGPGGYVCAIRASQLGMKTAIIEKYNSLGGTCLNVGCIPSKSLLDSSHHYEEAIKNFDAHGIELSGDIKVNLKKMIIRKNSVVEQTVKGVNFLMNKNKIDVFNGVGSFVDQNKVKIKNQKSEEIIESKNIVIATGSKPANLPFIKIDKERIITSTEALSLKEIPKKMTIIGGGVIGLELGQVYGRLGTEVSVIEYFDSIIPNMDKSLGRELMKVLKKQNIKFYLSHKVEKVERINNTIKIIAKDDDGSDVKFESDYCLVSVGRKPYTEGLNLNELEIKTSDTGQIIVNENLQTSKSNIYAIGDVIRGSMLAHKAEEEGIFVAEKIANQKPHLNYNLIPNVIYTWPEVASVGKTQLELENEGIEIKIGQFPMRALGRARASMDVDGFVKILADKNTDEVLGVHMIGARVADLIAEAVTAMEFRASAEDISRMSHSHPTYAEAIKEAALAATENRPIHI